MPGIRSLVCFFLRWYRTVVRLSSRRLPDRAWLNKGSPVCDSDVDRHVLWTGSRWQPVAHFDSAILTGTGHSLMFHTMTPYPADVSAGGAWNRIRNRSDDARSWNISGCTCTWHDR